MAAPPAYVQDTHKVNPNDNPKKKANCLQRAGSYLAGGLELFYYKLGFAIAKRPIITIVSVLVACFACAAGLAKFYEVDPSDPIWVDPKSTYITHKKWVDEKFPSQLRLSFYIAEGDNVLTPQTLLELYDLHYKITNISDTGYTYDDLCRRFGRGDNAECWSSSILELWSFNRTIIKGLTQASIIDTLNNTVKSPVTQADFDPTAYLGGITRDSSNHISSAKAAIFTYYMQGTNSSNTEYVAEDEVTKLTEEWELKFVDTIKEYSGSMVKQVYAFSSRSFGDEIGSSIFGDVYLLSAGYVIIMIYVALVLGRFNCVEMRVYLALGGVLAVGLSIAVSFGLSSAFGIGYGPVQSILPFLLLGLGVDDAFVIVQAWNRLTPHERSLPLTEQSGHALKHAGVSITVTSITDIVAFGIGATTVLPALRDFCIYAAIGIIAVFIIQATFFNACVVLDEKRQRAQRNGCCCCYTHKEDYQPNSCSKRDLQQKFFEKIYAPFLMRIPVKIVVGVISLAFLALGIYGVVYLQQEYDPNSFIPKDSYVKDYFDSYQEHFPDLSVDSGYIYLHELSYYKDRNKINEMIGKLKADASVDGETVDSWLEGMEEWLKDTKCPWMKSHLNDTTKWPLDERRFNMLLTPYIYMSADGRRHISDIKFNETIEFGDGNMPEDTNLTSIINSSGNLTNPNLTTPDILELEAEFAGRYLRTTRVAFDFITLPDSTRRVQAMDDTRGVVEDYYTDTNAFAFSRSFETWETDKIIQQELYRNMALAFGCVVVLTLLLIADIVTCLLVSVCVLSTLVEVGGFMYLWGLTIDTVTCIQLVLAIGLAVDYSAHIGHTFMTVVGDRNERTLKTLADIGPAVFNGGFSTLLAFLLLANSNSYVFDVFFRVNLLVVLLGLWNGMVLLPVLLSLLGPSPYLSAQLESPPGSTLKISNSAADNLALDIEDQFTARVSGEKGAEINNTNDTTTNINNNYQPSNTSQNGTAVPVDNSTHNFAPSQQALPDVV